MSPLLETLAKSLGSSEVSELSNQIGADEQTTKNALGIALPAILGALRKNTNSSDGADSLFGALGRDHDGSILERVSDFLGNRKQVEEKAPDRMLDHIFGKKRESVEEGVSQASGLKKAASSQLLKILGPLVLGAIAKQVTSKGLESKDLGGYLDQEAKEMEVKEKKFSLLGKFLDQDGDGDFDFKDIAKLGAGMFFGRK